MFGAAAVNKNPPYNPHGDLEVSVPPDLDGVSSLAWSPVANHLVATSWNNSVYVWDVQPTGQTVPKAQNKDHQQPVLCSAWNPDGMQVYTGGCDKTVRLWNLATNQSQQVRRRRDRSPQGAARPRRARSVCPSPPCTRQVALAKGSARRRAYRTCLTPATRRHTCCVHGTGLSRSASCRQRRFSTDLACGAPPGEREPAQQATCAHCHKRRPLPPLPHPRSLATHRSRSTTRRSSTASSCSR